MAKFILLGGPPGVGKSSVLQHLPRGVATLDADDVVDSATQPRHRAIEMVKHETERLLQSSAYARVLLSWVFARPQLYEPFLALAHDVRLVHLVCSAGELESRLHQRGDVALLDFALDRLQLIEALDFPRIDTSTKSPVEVAALLEVYMSDLP